MTKTFTNAKGITFRFGQRVRPIGWSKGEVFLVLGEEPSGKIQVARFNQKTAFPARDLEAV